MHDTQARRLALLANYGLLPKAKMPPGAKHFSTMNARAETLAQRRSYARPWHAAQRCLVPMQAFFEPSYRSGKAERWRIGLCDTPDFAVAGIYQSWEEENGQSSFSFTQITINADGHALMQDFHKPGDEKRALVILHESAYDAWLSSKNLAFAFSMLQACPAERMCASPAPLPPRAVKKTPQWQGTGDLFD